VHFWNHSSFTKTEKIIIVLTIKALLLLQDIQLSSQDFLALKTTAREDNNDVFAFLGRIFDEEPRTQPGFICRGENTITPFTLLHFQKILGILDAVGLFSKDKNVSLIGKNDILSLLAGISRVQNACNNKLARLDYLSGHPASLFGDVAQAASATTTQQEKQMLTICCPNF